MWIPKYDANAQSLPRIIRATATELQMEYDQFEYTAFQLLQGTMDSTCALQVKNNQIILSFRGK
ncbi:hypothetical protein [Paenibacillus qinlingensis]|uniref:hypothetical protein n=1 Tax=Paenibacillus qinlingensis TaxID=1837343 RepID=UPI001566C394|nr:hypothetical protein [Paenibacillus qinlingensis]NQX58191.1 hypothetical protein [Paenibacillus qinlingensis]